MAFVNPFQGALQVPTPDDARVAADTGRGQIVQLVNLLVPLDQKAANSAAGSSTAYCLGYQQDGGLVAIDLTELDLSGFVSGGCQEARDSIDARVRSVCASDALQAVGIVYPISDESPEIVIRVETDLGETLDATLPLRSETVDHAEWRFSYRRERSAQRLLASVIARSTLQSPSKQIDRVLTDLDVVTDAELAVKRGVNPGFLVLDYEDKLLWTSVRNDSDFDLAKQTLVQQCAAGQHQVCGVRRMVGDRKGLLTTVEHYSGASIRLGMSFEIVDGALKAGERFRLDPDLTFFQV